MDELPKLTAGSYTLEISPTNRAKCRTCGNLIDKGALRIQEHIGNNFGHAEYGYHHAKCAIKDLIKLAEEVDRMITTIDKQFKLGIVRDD